MKRILLAAACLAVLTACSEAENVTDYAAAPEASVEAPAVDNVAAETEAAAPADAFPDFRESEALAEPAQDASTSAVAPTPPPARRQAQRPSGGGLTLPKLAYRHQVAIETPSRSVAMLVEKHEDACIAAGPARCQVMGEDVRQESRNLTTGTLSLRAEGIWLEGFRKGLAADAESVGGRLVTNATETEELSRAIIDTDATMNAKIAMRDQLQTMVRTHKGTLPELMEVQRELAQVQSEIDGARANLSEMRGRVAMSEITINYGPKAGLVQDGAWSPVSGAVRSAQGLMAQTIAVLIMAFSVLLPVGAVVWAIVWGILRLNRRRTPTSQPAAQA